MPQSNPRNPPSTSTRRKSFIFDGYLKGVKVFIDEYWRMIHLAAGWGALRAFLLVRKLCSGVTVEQTDRFLLDADDEQIPHYPRGFTGPETLRREDGNESMVPGWPGSRRVKAWAIKFKHGYLANLYGVINKVHVSNHQTVGMDLDLLDTKVVAKLI